VYGATRRALGRSAEIVASGCNPLTCADCSSTQVSGGLTAVPLVPVRCRRRP